MPALISVIIPAYNCEETLARAVDSVLAQDYEPVEIIVVDDGSTDGTAEVARGFGEAVRLIVQENAGPGVARNRGVEAARGEFIAFLDADDEYLPGRLAKGLAPLVEDRGLALSHCQCMLTLPDGREELSGERFLRMEPFRPERVLNPLYHSTPSATMRRDVFLELGGFDVTLRNREDHDLWMRVQESYGCACIAEPLVRVYRSPSSLSGSTSADAKAASVRRLIHSALERCPDFYAPERKGMLAWMEWHCGVIWLSGGKRGAALGAFLRAFFLRPCGRLLPFLGLSLLPDYFVQGARRLFHRGKKGQ